MARTMRFVTLVIAMFAIGCGAAKGKAEGCIGANCDKPKAPPLLSDNELVILYDCVPDESSPAYLEWCPGTEEGKHLPRIMMQAAEFSGLEPSGVEPYSKSDKGRNYILIYFFEEDVVKGKITLIRHQWMKNTDTAANAPKEKLVQNEVILKKSPNENWHKFYRRGFSSLMEESETESNPSQDENVDAGVDDEDEGEAKPKPKPITVFTTPDCPLCDEAMNWLTANKIDFVEKNLESDKVAEQYLKDKLQIDKPLLAVYFDLNGKIHCGWPGGEAFKAVMALPPSDNDPKVNLQEFLILVNAYRKKEGLSEVAYNDKLEIAAFIWATNYSASKLKGSIHNHKGSTLAKRLKKVGYAYKTTPVEIVDRYQTFNVSFIVNTWMLDLANRHKDLMKKDVTEIGCSCIEATPAGDDVDDVCVAVLASPKGAKGSKESKELKAQITPFEVE